MIISLALSFYRYLHTVLSLFFFFNDPATTEIYTLSLHDALPISPARSRRRSWRLRRPPTPISAARSEEHTSELQSHSDLVCRLLLEKKKKKTKTLTTCHTRQQSDTK